MVAFSDLIVVIPGILGSRLVRGEGKHAHVVYDLSIKSLPRMLRAMRSGGLVLDDGDDVRADRLFSNQLIPGFIGVDDYDSLVRVLVAATSAQQVVTFPYDWRRSNAIAAQGLADLVDRELNRWAQTSGARHPKVWLIAHSMGGLVARYYCEQLGGAAHTRAIVTIGTPHRGSAKALDVLANGKRFPSINLDEFVRSLPSVYELLPLFPVLRTGSGDVQRLLRIADTFGLDPTTGEDLPDRATLHPLATEPGTPVDDARSEVARGAEDGRLRHLAPLRGLSRTMVQQALRFHAGIRGPAEARGAAPAPYAQRVIFNRRQHTAHSAAVSGAGLQMFDTYPVLTSGRWVETDERGDGTVPAQSAVPIEWADTSDAIPNAQKHTGIQGTREAQDAIRNWLLPADTRAFRGAGVNDADVIVLDVPPVIDHRDPLEVTVSAATGTYATIRVTDQTTGVMLSQPAAVTDEPRTLSFVGLPPGVHKVSAVPRARTHPSVSDYTYLVGPDG